MEALGYRGINLVDVSATTSDEQRSTEWMRFDSLTTFLDPNDSLKTVEGYPGPKRAFRGFQVGNPKWVAVARRSAACG